MLLSSRFSEKVFGVSKRFLQHTCTLVTYEATGDTDEDTGQPTYTTNEESDVACLFLWDSSVTTDERGNIVQNIPQLYLLANQTVSEGDLVQNVLSRNGTVILQGAKINTIDGTAEGGDYTLKVCQLEGAVI